jgi:hypothetical protein
MRVLTTDWHLMFNRTRSGPVLLTCQREIDVYALDWSHHSASVGEEAGFVFPLIC